MALAHTILTVLCEQPHSGYAISKLFEETIACYWKASQQQIDRELAGMEAKGSVSHQLVPQAGKPTPIQEVLDYFHQHPQQD
ncbi:MAG: PadR family transcriptional regulator [Cyanobacteria bacterium]|nr:PadR family transcriptional regulator [Cyanobacteria bacterium bin.51]